MVWAGFSSVGKLRLAFISHRMKSLHYQRVLRNCLMPFYRLHPRNGFVFMQDNAPIHSVEAQEHGWERAMSLYWNGQHVRPTLIRLRIYGESSYDGFMRITDNIRPWKRLKMQFGSHGLKSIKKLPTTSF